MYKNINGSEASTQLAYCCQKWKLKKVAAFATIITKTLCCPLLKSGDWVSHTSLQNCRQSLGNKTEIKRHKWDIMYKEHRDKTVTTGHIVGVQSSKSALWNHMKIMCVQCTNITLFLARVICVSSNGNGKKNMAAWKQCVSTMHCEWVF